MSILWLDQVTLEDRADVGGKAAALGALRRAGLCVPNGFCITAEAEREGAEFWSKVASAYYRLASDDGVVAVRSSGVSEDSPEASFAGQYETFLDVRGSEALRSAIERCWQSAQSSRIRAYQTWHGYNGGDERLPVLIQRQIPATMSGVLFTVDPVSGSDTEMLIEATSGLGDELVSGRVAPARYSVDRQGRVRVLSLEELLTSAQCRALAELGAQVEQVLGRGQDIEWALSENEIHILQARPITRGGAPMPLSQVWTRANIGEVLPHVITPLTWAVFRATLLNDPALALSASDVDDHGSEGIRRIHGRAYVRLDSLLDSFCYLPTITPQVMHRVLGVDLPPAAESYARPTGLFVRLAQGVFVLDAMRFLPRLSLMVGRLPPPPVAGPERLAELVSWTARCFQSHLKCTAYAIGAFGLLTHLLSRWMPSQAEMLLPQVLTGHENLQTAAQGISLWQLAEQVLAHPALRQTLEEEPNWSVAVERLASADGGPEFLEAFQTFLEENGARAAGEFELSVPRWREDPSFVLDVLHKYLDAQQTEASPGDPTKQRCFRQDTIARAQAALGPMQRWALGRLLASYSDYTALRENVKYRLMEGYAMLRHTFLEIGANLAASGVIEDAADIFFLTPSEMLAPMTREERAGRARELIAARKKQHADWESHEAPDLIAGGGPVGASESEGLIGIGCSPGRVEGVARVLYDVSEADTLRPGEILVAPHTDPGWTLLFLSCKAVVTEIGGFLSHGATVAREYGIPAVVNVKGATARIQTGDLIQVDGTNGRIAVGDWSGGRRDTLCES